MHYQIFLPNCVGLQPRELAAVGLADHIDGAAYMDVAPGDSPSAAGGVVVSWSKGIQRVGVVRDQQTWLPAVAWQGLPAARYFVGTWNDSPPVPADLARNYQHRGPLVPFGDGRDWRLPAARELPHQIQLADDGTWRFELRRQFHAFGLMVDDFRSLIAQDKSVSYAVACEFVLAALRLNYRLTPELALNVLQLLDTDNILPAVIQIVAASEI